ncbi:MAG: DUF1580 domain-containing protein [Phycisphaeraceae bacterium]
MNDLIPLIDIPKLLPKRHGKSIHIRTVRRWATKGLKGRRLQTVRVGGRYYVRLEWLEHFIAMRPTQDPTPVPARVLSARRTREREAARRRAQEIFGLK